MRKLINKSYKQYDYTSRYSPFPIYYNVNDNKYVSGVTAYLDDSTIYTLHVVEPSDTFDTLALRYYNNPTLYWIICSFNHIQNPFTELTVGQKIKIPVLSNIIFDGEGRS